MENRFGNLKKGLHIYINIKNFNDLIDYDVKSGYQRLNSLFQAVDLFLKRLEEMISSKLTKNVYIEKITDSRIHCVIEDNYQGNDLIASDFYKLISFAFRYIKIINNNISRFYKIDDLILNVGVDYGHYIDYTINYVNPSEDNSIGYPCNKAAKIQNSADRDEVLLSSEAYKRLTRSPFLLHYVEASKYRDILKGTIYEKEETFYSLSNVNWDSVDSDNKIIHDSALADSFAKDVKSINNRVLNESVYLDKSINRKDDNSILLCDIRGFTKMFKEDGSNLLAMARTTVDCLSKMYDTSSKKLQHIQFQGDREVANGRANNVQDAINTAFELIESFKENQSKLESVYILDSKNVSIGIGIAHGAYYTAKVGARGSKDPLLLGKIPMYANIAEDKYAKDPFAIALHKSAYDKVVNENPSSAIALTVKYCFSKVGNSDYYLLNKGIDLNNYIKVYNKYTLEANKSKQSTDGGKPWRNE